MSAREGSDIRLTDLAPAELMEMFPEAKLTLRDRIPTNMLYLYTFLNLNKAIKDIKHSEAEIREAVLALIAMVPDELRDEKFKEEIGEATKSFIVDVRPSFCQVKASVEYCQRNGIPITQEIPKFDYFALYHAVFNLLERKNMLFKKQPKEIMTGFPAVGKEKNVEEIE